MTVNRSYISMGIIALLFGIFLIFIMVTSNASKLEQAAEHPVPITGTVFSCNAHYAEDDDIGKFTYDVQINYRAKDETEETAHFYGLLQEYTIGSEIELRFREDMSDPVLASSVSEEDSFNMIFICGFGVLMVLSGIGMITAVFIKRP